MVEVFRRIQIGEEAAKGTAVVSTDRLYGALTLTPNIVFHRPEDERNSLAQYFRAKATSHMSSMQFTGSATYEQLRYFLAMCLRTPTIDIPATGVKTRDYIYIPTLTAKNTQKTFTIEYGDDDQSWEASFAFLTSLQLGIALGDIVSVTATMTGQFPIKTAFTPNLDESVVNEIISDGAKFYIDDDWASLGTTERNAMLVGGTINLNSGLAPVRYARGLTTIGTQAIATYHALSQQRRSHSIDLDIIVSSDAIDDVYDAYAASTTKAIRIAFADAGTAQRIEAPSFYRGLIIDMIGKFTSDPEFFGSRDGEDMFRITFTSHDDGNGNELGVTLRLNNDDL